MNPLEEGATLTVEGRCGGGAEIGRGALCWTREGVVALPDAQAPSDNARTRMATLRNMVGKPPMDEMGSAGNADHRREQVYPRNEHQPGDGATKPDPLECLGG